MKTKQDQFEEAAAQMRHSSFGACDAIGRAVNYEGGPTKELRDIFAKMYRPKRGAHSYYFGKSQIDFKNDDAEAKARQRRVDALLLAAVAYEDFE